MNYIREIRAFYDWLEVNSLPPGAIVLWHALMHINNKTGWSCEFTVANKMLESLTGLSRQGLDRARGLLIQRGLIEYTKGRGNKAGKYKIKSVCNIVGTTVDTVVDTVVDTKRTQIDTQSGHSSSTLNKLNKTKLNNNNKSIAEPKTKYAEFVSMTNAEYEALVTKLGDEGRVKRCIEILDNYKGATGKKYKSDYRAILNWVITRLEEEEQRNKKAVNVNDAGGGTGTGKAKSKYAIPDDFYWS